MCCTQVRVKGAFHFVLMYICVFSCVCVTQRHRGRVPTVSITRTIFPVISDLQHGEEGGGGRGGGRTGGDEGAARH